MIAFTACVPQTFVHYEALYAFAVVRTRAQCLALALCSYLALVWGDSLAPPATLLEAIKHIGPLIIVFVYLPALWILLRQPNEGSVPAWVEQAVASCPQWIRGSVAPNSRLG